MQTTNFFLPRAPDVAGIAAGVLSSNPAFTPADVAAEIDSNSVKRGVDSRTPSAGLATVFHGAGGTRFPTHSPTTAEPTPPPTPCQDGTTVEVRVTTDAYPSETEWVITDQCGAGVEPVSGGPYAAPNAAHSSGAICLPGGMYQFEITDKFGDGESNLFPESIRPPRLPRAMH